MRRLPETVSPSPPQTECHISPSLMFRVGFHCKEVSFPFQLHFSVFRFAQNFEDLGERKRGDLVWLGLVAVHRHVTRRAGNGHFDAVQVITHDNLTPES